VTEPHVVSWSEISAARQCPHKHQLAYKERWRIETTSKALKVGLLWHEVLEQHYSGAAGDEIEQTIADHDDLEHRDLVRWMWDGYQQRYEIEPWETVAAEEPFEVPLDREGRYILKGRVDLHVVWRDRAYLVDHKSGARLPSDKELALEDQLGLYAWAMRELGRPVFGMCWNAALTKRNKIKTQDLDDRFRRIYLHRTDSELDTVAAEALATIRYVYETGAEWRAPDVERCRWRCDYTEACLLGRQNGPEIERDALRSYGFAIDLERH